MAVDNGCPAGDVFAITGVGGGPALPVTGGPGRVQQAEGEAAPERPLRADVAHQQTVEAASTNGHQRPQQY